jgi:hypothetical protein
MSTRLFSIIRRKYSILDFSIPPRPESEGVVGYRFKTDTDPGGTFATTVFTTSIIGFVDSSVAGPQHVIQNNKNIRVILDPSKYSISDEYAFWLKLVYVDGTGAEMSNPAPSAATLILPPFVGNEQSGFNGTAPEGTSLSDSLRIDLPFAMQNFRIRNLEESTVLYVAFQEGGPEVSIPGGVESSEIYGLVSSIWVRGISGTAAFTAQFVYANPR